MSDTPVITPATRDTMEHIGKTERERLDVWKTCVHRRQRGIDFVVTAASSEKYGSCCTRGGLPANVWFCQFGGEN